MVNMRKPNATHSEGDETSWFSSKSRTEAFSDGVIAIIITIMVLSIPLPKTFAWGDILAFGTALFIYLLSFLVVGAFWNQHHQAFLYLNKMNGKIVVANIFFLFFLSLIPLFTKWVIENQGSLIPVIGFDAVYLMVSFFYLLTFRLIMSSSKEQRMKEFAEMMKNRKRAHPRQSWFPVIVLMCIIGVMVIVSIYLPKISIVILMGIPIFSSIVNLLNTEQKRGMTQRK